MLATRLAAPPGPAPQADAGADEPQREAKDRGAAIGRWYGARGHAPAWTGDAGTRAARALVTLLRDADSHGLDRRAYDGDELAAALTLAAERPLEAAGAADLDLRLTRAYVRYAGDLVDGRVDPRDIGLEWYTEAREIDVLELLDRALAATDPATVLAELAPPAPGYEPLRRARDRYAALVRAGGWEKLPAGSALEPGSRGAAVLALRRRLHLGGDLPAAAGPAHYDAGVAAAVRRFQRRHGLQPTGKVDVATRMALDLPAAARLAQIDLNLERARWLPASLGERHLAVNVPEFMLRAVENDRVVLTMRVIVGKPYRATPVFSDRMTHVTFHPYWNVPTSITREEIVPAVLEDPDYLASQDMEVLGDDGQPLDAGHVDWAAVDPTSIRIRQRPGAGNALGKVKFMFPNQLNIYLHDTPADHLFDRVERDFSHGCIRVEDPARLAEYVLRGSDWTRARVDRALAGATHRDVRLPRALPVHILYATAWVDETGTLQFREDIYEHDRRLAEALRGGAPRPLERPTA